MEQLIDVQDIAREVSDNCPRRNGENCNVVCRVSGEKTCCAYCEHFNGFCLCDYMRRERHFRERDYFRRVEKFLYDVSFAQAALKDLQMEYDAKRGSQRITASYSGVAVSGGQASSKQERYTERMDFLEREIGKRNQVIHRYELVLEQVRKHKNGENLVNLIKWKYLDGHDNDTVWRMLAVDRATFYRWRNQVVDTAFRCLPSRFLEQYKEG